MMEVEVAPRILLPERLEPHRRFGPFRSASDGMKFLLVASVGALIGLRYGLLWWTPFLGGGMVLGLYRKDGRGIDERFGGFARWRLRRVRSGEPHPARSAEGSGVLRLRSGFVAAAIEAGGVPVAYLPAEDARRLFEAYCELLRAGIESFTLSVGSVPVRSPTLLPRTSPPSERADRPAHDAYREMLRVLARRRRMRRVTVLFLAPPGRDAVGALERAVSRWTSTLERLGVPARRLHGPAIERARAGAPGAGTG